jgi:hypothetical protein
MDFNLSPEPDTVCLAMRTFVEARIIPEESAPTVYCHPENIAEHVLSHLPAQAKAEG